MPVYEYTCKSCDARFEQLVKSMNGQTRVKCPKCGSMKTDRALSVFAVGAEAPKSSSRPPACAGCQGGPSCPMEG